MTSCLLNITRLGSLADLKDICLDEISQRYRSRVSANLLHIEISEYDMGVCVVLAPIDQALCILGEDSAVINAMQKWSQSLSRTEDQYHKFIAMMRSQGVSKASLNPAFINWIGGAYKTSSGYKELLSSRAESLGEFRLVSYISSMPNCRGLIDHFMKVNLQLSRFASCEAKEGIERSSHASASSYRYDEFDPICVFLHPRKPDIRLFTEGREREEEMTRVALKEAIAALEAGRGFPWEMHYTNYVRPPLSIPFLSGSVSQPVFERWAAVDFELLSLRCRLVRLLGWPQLFGRIANRFDADTGAWSLAPRYGSDYQREQLSKHIGKYRVPYDPMEEIDAYLAEMVGKYPVLLEAPF